MQYIPVIVFAIILIIIAFFLKRGKGLWLLAGFNTMSVEERNVYDMEKIGRFISKTLTGMALCLLAFDFGPYINNITIITIMILFSSLLIFLCPVFIYRN